MPLVTVIAGDCFVQDLIVCNEEVYQDDLMTGV